MVTVLVVDDSEVDRRLVGELLAEQWRPGIQFAANGREAVARMEESVPEVVITDLQMPEMDGLELVDHVRLHHPRVPVILMTAFGSELLAVEALRRGAASYVPKSQLAERLASTLDEVLALAQAKSSYEHLIGCLTGTEFNFCLENDESLVDALVSLVQQMVVGMEFCDFTGRLRIGVALNEALRNALYHGNLEISFEQLQRTREELLQGQSSEFLDRRRMERPYRDRRIFVKASLYPDEVRLVVRDEGDGFDVKAVPDPDDPESLEPERGRGLSLMRTLMDEVVYNAEGNEVTLIKRRETGAEPIREAVRADSDER
jgi:CheY-like chemotaxis protein/anti-sigma regulatory factor (Ser/Thr protein kinase)